MAQKPMLFSTPLVRAIEKGEKKETRRLLKPAPQFRENETGAPVVNDDGTWCFQINEYTTIYDGCWTPFVFPGDTLYVREAWNRIPVYAQGKYPPQSRPVERWDYVYRALSDDNPDDKWRPSIHMPKEAARLFLSVKDVTIERLQDITVEGILNEGVSVDPPGACKAPDFPEHFGLWPKEKQEQWFKDKARASYIGWVTDYVPRLFKEFQTVWDATVPKDKLPLFGWDANPWVWVYKFEKVKKAL